MMLFGAASSGLLAVAPNARAADAAAAFADSPFRKLTAADWRKRLSPAAFAVLRQEDTEAPFISPLNHEHRSGLFVCAGCDLPLFRSEWKFDSGTGWPSFFRAMETSVARQRDFAIGVLRIEYHCARCLGHQGHVFDDGPKPTGLRYCNNGAALKFVANQARRLTNAP
jgi:peptide-methionine (R)-S-oxide reductase